MKRQKREAILCAFVQGNSFNSIVDRLDVTPSDVEEALRARIKWLSERVREGKPVEYVPMVYSAITKTHHNRIKIDKVARSK